MGKKQKQKKETEQITENNKQYELLRKKNIKENIFMTKIKAITLHL